MRALRVHSGRMAPLDRDNVDTDQIIPKQFLRRIERSGFGPFLFHDWRRDEPDFVLDRSQYRGASVLVTGANFGCGSSREHAPWALEDSGYRVVIAPSFADIFRSNCGKIGVLAVALPEARVRQLMSIAEEAPETELTVDLEKGVIAAPGFEATFEVDPFTRESLLNGWDEVAITLRQDAEITAYEQRAGAV
ncbi:MAG: 3-isopropylmalate dehydratase small subunit [Chloroflexota bacterium]